MQRGFLGFTTRQLRTYGTRIHVQFSDQARSALYGGPSGALSVSDYGDVNIQDTHGVAFDIYRFPTEAKGNQYGTQHPIATITFPASTGGKCPAGYRASVMYLPLLAAAILAPSHAVPACRSPGEKQAHLQWSEPNTVVAPNRTWAAEVRPVLTADENASPLVLYRCGGKQAVTVMRLSRSADLVWSDDGRTLLVIEQAAAESYSIRLFRIRMDGENVSVSEKPGVDKSIRAAVAQRLGPRSKIQFYTPVLVAWKRDQLSLGIKGNLSERVPGPTKSSLLQGADRHVGSRGDTIGLLLNADDGKLWRVQDALI